MPEIQFAHVVSFSSQDPHYPAENLIKNSSSHRKWRSHDPGLSHITAVFQMQKAALISSIDIGNDGSAFVEIQVGRRAIPDDFHVLLPAASFMSPIESRNEQNLHRVRMFSGAMLQQDVAKQQWDQIKVICTQPFNKHVKFGLSFLKAHSAEQPTPDLQPSTKRLGPFLMKDQDVIDEPWSLDSRLPTKVGQLFAKLKSTEVSRPSSTTTSTVAEDLKSQRTLASLVLSSHEASRKRRLATAPASPASCLPVKKSSPSSPLLANSSKNHKPQMRRDFKEVKRERPVRSSQSKPFNQLLEGVVMVISGFQNPLRGQIREKGLAMGARYKAEWDSNCTHLICAFANTPKFREVKAAMGKIVKVDFIEKCFSDRKRYPWRRFCLDTSDQGPESEEEIEAATQAVGAQGNNDDDDPMDTDEELEQMTQVRGQNSSISNKDLDSDDVYNADTDVDDDQTDDDETQLASSNGSNRYFEGQYFLLYGPLGAKERHDVEGAIRSAGGVVNANLMANSRTDVVVTRQPWDRNFDKALTRFPRLDFVLPDYILQCHASGGRVDRHKYLINRPQQADSR